MVDRSEAMEKEFAKSPGGNYFNYVDTAKLEREGITQFKPRIGENAVRIVFPTTRPVFYGMEIYKHSTVGADRKTFICRKKMFNESCPICDYVDSLRKENPNDKRLKELRPTRRYLFFVVEVLDESSEAKGIRWWDCPIGIYKEIKSRSKNRRRGEEGENFKKWIDVSDPKDGRDIIFEQVKEQGKYSYEGVRLETSQPIPEAWYKDLPEFKDILKDSSEEEMEEALSLEMDPEEGDVEREVEEDAAEPEDSTESDGTHVEKEKVEKEESKSEFPSRGTSPAKEEKQKEESDLRSRVRERLEKAKEARKSENEGE